MFEKFRSQKVLYGWCKNLTASHNWNDGYEERNISSEIFLEKYYNRGNNVFIFYEISFEKGNVREKTMHWKSNAVSGKQCLIFNFKTTSTEHDVQCDLKTTETII